MILMPHKKYTCLALGLMISLSSSQLFAHSKLLSASPAAESTIAKSPKQITISFNEKTVLKKIELHDANHNVIPLKFKPRTAASQHYTFNIPALKDGTYNVHWKLKSKDQHLIDGSYKFIVDQTAP